MPDRFLINRQPLTDAEFAARAGARPELHRFVVAARAAVARQCRVRAELLYPEDLSKALMNLAPDDWDDLFIQLALEEIIGQSLATPLPLIHGSRFFWWGKPGPKSLGEWCVQVAECLQRQGGA